MPKSMTGYGRGMAKAGGQAYQVDVKSVNSRFLEASFKLPPALWQHEAEARALLGKAVGRGKLDLVWKDLGEGRREAGLAVDKDLARQVLKAWKELGSALGLKDPVRLDQVARHPDVIRAQAATEPGARESAARWDCLKKALTKALDSLNASREREGAALAKELKARLARSLELTEAIEGHSAALVQAFRERLARRLGELLERFKPDDPRLLTEAALVAERSDIREELVRFRIHVAEFRRLLDDREPMGKRLDFLTQELLREVNTMGSKSADAKVAHFVVELKGEIEKIKEQVQNVE